jgi:hypothetical protein
VCVRFATAKQDETLLSLPSCATIAASARRDSRNKVATLYYVKVPAKSCPLLLEKHYKVGQNVVCTSLST